MFELSEFRNCLRRVAHLLDACQTRYFLTGGAAAIAYGDPRTTQDVDLVVDATALEKQLTNFFSHLDQERFLFNETTIRHAVTSGRQFQLIDIDSTLKIDLYPRELVPGGLDRAVEIEVLPGLELPVASRADLVVSKLIWISKGSHKSRRDVRQIMMRASVEEIALVNQLADSVSLRPLLNEVLAEPDEIDLDS